MINRSEHLFHIPVMGIAFTIDSPIKVARFGISSVISIVEDRLIEMMRKHYYPMTNKPYFPITHHEPDYRARRITNYLNLVQTIVQKQIQELKSEAFESGSEIVKYFEMLPDNLRLKKLFHEMMLNENRESKAEQESYLRSQIVSGSIDVNIMTKVDHDCHDKDGNIIQDGSEAVSALRGFANSDLENCSVIFSAGLNPRLYNYLEHLKAFDPGPGLEFKKKVIIKVSDYRSALIQGKYLAKKGIWVSEFRIESGLNCGGHAFATDGYLLGPILEEFKMKKLELIEALFEIYQKAIEKKSGIQFDKPPVIEITVQGGIGTHAEHKMLLDYYEVARTGWGTPFLLVPEATTVDQHTLSLLQEATENDIILSRNSPLGVRFHYLRGTTADLEKQARIEAGTPGSPCTEKHLAFNTEFTTEPICTASKTYQKHKLKQLKALDLPEGEFEKQRREVLDKECLCIGLSNAAALLYEETFLKKFDAVNICPGPNITNFSKVVSLETMTSHIYGRMNILNNNTRPHMFIAELMLYVNYIGEKITDCLKSDEKQKNYISGFIRNLMDGITYYKNSAALITDAKLKFIDTLEKIEKTLDRLVPAEHVLA